MRSHRRRLVLAAAILTAGAVLWSAGRLEARPGRATAPAVETRGGHWIDHTPPGPAPMPKGAEDCAGIYDPIRDRLIVYGGKGDGDMNTNDTWAFDPGTKAWEPLATTGLKPPSSEDHTAVFDPIGYRLILHGGENGPTTNKLWALDLKTLEWRNLTSPESPRRESHTAVYDSRGKRMVIFGGFDRTQADLHDVWALDLDPASPTFEKWQDLSVPQGRPAGRIDQSAVYDPDKNRMLFNGGWTKARKVWLGDTWAFWFGGGDAAARWEKIDTSRGAPPDRRYGVGVHDPDRHLYLLFGGENRSGFLNDVWAFDLARDVWMKVTTPEPGPAPRMDHQAVYDSRRHSLLVYGGDGGLAHKKLHDVWELTLDPAPTPSGDTSVPIHARGES